MGFSRADGGRRPPGALVSLWLTCLCLCAAPRVSAQPLDQWFHSAWTERNGLYGSVRAITQTTDGFLWIGTSAGLRRFDGITFEAYQPQHGSLPTAVSALLATDDGGLWIGGEHGGISYLRDGVVRTFSEQDGYPYGATRGLARTRDGVVWAAVVGALVRFDGQRWEKVRSSWNYPGKSARCVFVDRQGTLWVGTDTGISYLPSGSDRFEDVPYKSRFIAAITQAADGTLWFSDGERDIVRPLRSPLESSAELPSVPIALATWDLRFSRDGSLWLATEDGVRRLASVAALTAEAAAHAESFALRQGLSDSTTHTLFEDREGNLWVGTSSGLDRFRRRKLSWSPVEGKVLKLALADDGDVIIAFDSPQPPIRLSDRQPVPILNGLTHVSRMSRSVDGSVWLATVHGLWRWKAGKLEQLKNPALHEDLRAYAATADAAGTAYVSIAGYGQFRYEHDRWTHLTILAGEPDITPVSAHVDGGQRLWLAYDVRQRVAGLDGGRVQLFGPEQGLQVGSPDVIAGDAGEVWVGGDTGVAVLRGDRFQTLPTLDGETFAVYGIVPSRHDGLWLTTSRGILHVSPQDTQRCLATSCDQVSYEVLDLTTDLPEPLQRNTAPGNDATSGAIQGLDGRLWFATSSGVAVVDPPHVMRNTVPPPLAVTSVIADRRPYATGAPIVLPANTRVFTIDYTALSFTTPERVRFKLWLEGWDKDWQDAGSRRQVSYSNLGPGTYVFHVTARNNDGVWNGRGMSQTIVVRPAYYQTTWFAMLAVLLAGVLLWLLVSVRANLVIRRSNELLLERLAERERIAQDLHDTFLQSVQGLLLRFQAAVGQLRPDEPARTLLEETLEQSDKVLLEGRALIIDLHTTTISSSDLVGRLEDVGREYVLARPVELAVTSMGMASELNAIVSEEICRIGREALSNAFRHAGAARITVEVRYAATELAVSIQDDGQGIEPSVLQAGHRVGHYGLRDMRERARRIGGRLTLRSSPSSGTEVEVRVPAHVAYTRQTRSWWDRIRRRIHG